MTTKTDLAASIKALQRQLEKRRESKHLTQVEKERRAWAAHQKMQARKNEANRIMLTDPEKGRRLLAAIRKEEMQAKVAERKAQDRSVMSRRWVESGGDPDDFTDEIFEELYNQLVKERTLQAFSGSGRVGPRPSQATTPLKF